MKFFLAGLLILAFTSMLSAQYPTPFNCDNYYYIATQLSSGGTNGGSKLEQVSGSSTTLIKTTGAGQTFNAIGYNSFDNFIYGAQNIAGSSNIIFRIGSNGGIETLTISGLPSNVAYNTGDVDEYGYYYVKAGGANNKIYKINLVSLTATLITLSSTVTISDLAIFKKDASGDIYAYTIGDGVSNPHVYKIKNSGSSGVGTVTDIGATGLNLSSGVAPGGPYFGGQFVDNNSNFYVFENGSPANGDSARLYKVNITTGQATFVKNLPPSERNDGAFCRLANFSSILPITWEGFTIKASNENAIITWRSYSEENVKEYSIEASANGLDFKTIGIIAAKSAGANRNDYSFTQPHAASFANRIYYRVKQTDFDGHYSYTTVVTTSFKTVNSEILHLYPNPCRRGTQFSIQTNSSGTYKIYSIDGVSKKEGKINNTGSIEISTNNLPAGLYTVTTNNGKPAFLVIQ